MQVYGAFKLSSTKPDVGWVGAYSHFLPNREIFKPYSVQTVLFTKMFRSGFVQHLGNGNRFCKLSHVENINDSFLKFVREYKVDFDPSHRQAFRNLEAGYKSAAKYDRPQPDYDKHAFGLACSFLRKHFSPFVAGARVLGEETVILDLDRSTAAGYPWNMIFHTKGEMLDAGFLEPIQWYWMLIGAIAYQIPIALRYNQQYHPIWTNTEKREIREIIKIIEDKIRTFTASPIEFTVAANRMCLDFNNMFYEAASSCSFVGRSKFMQGWHRLYVRLGKYQTGFEFDASSWDASVFRDALWDQMAFRWESYMSEYQTPENRRRLTHIYGEIVNSVIILESEKGVADIIMKNTGNPSGSANTIVDNTMVLYRVFAYCWIRLCPKEMLDKGYPAFNDNVCMVLNGDDNTMTVSPEALLFFNAPNIIRVANELGVVLTTPSEIPRHVLDLSFLSHQPVMETGFSGAWILPAPYYNRVLSSLAYGSEVNDVRWHLLRAAALRVDSWAHPQLRRVIMDYIKYVLRRYKNQLYGTIHNVKIEDIFNMIQTDEWCFALYTGLESGVGTVKQIPHKINFAMSLVRSEGIADLSLIARSFNPPPQKGEISVLPISPGTIGQPIKILVQRKRKRTGDPDKDGLVGVERNPGPEAFNPISAQSNVRHEPGPHYDRNVAGHYLNEWQHGNNEHWYQPSSIVGTDSALPPLLAALTGFSNQIHTGESHVTLAKPRHADGYKRERTGNPYTDGLVGIESNPGPKNGAKKNKMKKAVKKMEKKVESAIIRRPRAPGRRKRVKIIAQTQQAFAPVATGSVTAHNIIQTTKCDNLIADCVKTGGVNVRGMCFSNIGVGTNTRASPGDYDGIFLNGVYQANGYLAFNFDDFDDRIHNLAQTYQYYRVRSLEAVFIPMVSTTVTGQWALGINDNFYPTSSTIPTSINSLLTNNIAKAGTAWVSASLPPYVYNSAKVWSTVKGPGSSIENDIYTEQLTFLARSLIPTAAGSPLEYGRFQFKYSIDFFEPRADVGTVTLRYPSPSLVRSVFTKEDKLRLRFEKVSVCELLANRLKILLDEYHNSGKDEVKECDSPFVMEQNPLTQSIHIPKNVVERLAHSLTGDVIRRV